MKKKLIKIGIFGFIFILLIIATIFKNKLNPNLKINEVSFQNNNGEDWIEIYNPNLSTKNLKGMYLTDDKAEKNKFKIEKDIAINPKGFLVIGGKNADKKRVAIKTNFGFKNGETIYLINSTGGEIIDALPLILENEKSTQTVGRFPDGSDEIFTFSNSTRGTNNNKDKQ